MFFVGPTVLHCFFVTSGRSSIARYASKKVLLARKMDRLEALSRVKMEFIKNLNRNNEQKRNAILYRTDAHVRRASDDGLEKAVNLFGEMKKDMEKKKSIPKRLKVIQKHCIYVELQANQGMLFN